ncbi:MAG TPA: serine hydrolase domain-containing protein, partial [Catenuloplanes sp.]
AGTWRAASGVSRLGQPGRAPVDGRFRTGSVTKTFVATVVLQLAAEHRLRLDDPVERWLPGRVNNGGRITLRHLLTHTSGLYNYTNDVIPSLQDWLGYRYRTWQPADLLAVANRQPPLFAPGEGWAYSNTNYIALGMVIEAVTGRGYATEIRDRIIRPLRLRQTESPGRRLGIAGPHAHGYLPREEAGTPAPVDVTRINPTIAGAAGDMITSTADLNTFFRALLTGRLLPPARLAEMKTAVSDGGYGMGLEQTTLPCGATVFGHGGGIFGYATLSFHTADAHRQLTVSINPYTGDLDAPAIALLNRVFCPTG